MQVMPGERKIKWELLIKALKELLRRLILGRDREKK